MTETAGPKFTIVGGGLAGALMANYLAEAGYQVDVYEKRPDFRKGKAGPGRSINLALSVRGIHALDQLGLADEVLSSAVPMRGRLIHPPRGALSFQPYSKNEREVINSVSRAGLNITMLKAADARPGVRIFFNQKCTDADLETASARLVNVETGAESSTNGTVLIGADGAFSAVRGRMQRLDRFDFRQDYLGHGYKELTIPPGPNGHHQLEANALHIWPRRSFMMIALPNQDGSFTCTLFWPFEGPISFAALKTSDDIQQFFNEHFPDAAELMPTLVKDYQQNPASSLATVRCGPWYVRDKVVLIGDAAHAVVPFYGQGINAGFEDCVVLDECIRRYACSGRQACSGRHAPDFERAFENYYRLRKEHTDALAELAIGNFIEMRDNVGSPAFLRKKRRERRLHGLLANWYVPLYSMVTFSRIPYAQAVRRAKRQERAVGLACRTILVAGAMFLMWLVWWLS